MPRTDPFMTDVNPITGTPMGAVTTANRLNMVKRFTRAECMDALFIDEQRGHLQSSVRAALARRLRVLEKQDLAEIRRAHRGEAGAA